MSMVFTGFRHFKHWEIYSSRRWRKSILLFNILAISILFSPSFL
jgi:hypothetical protein